MSEHEPGDELRIDIEDMREPRAASVARSTARSLVYPPRSRRWRRARRATVSCVLALGIVVALYSIPALRQGAIGLVTPHLPAPLPTLAPGANRFYLLPNPPGVEVSLDGHLLSAPPAPGDLHPLILPRGRHILTWRSTHFPMQPQNCVVSVPAHASADTCPLSPASPVARSAGYVITLHLSLGTLRQEHAQGLVVAIQDALAAARFTAVVQPGEHYYLDTPSPHVAVATKPLVATLDYTQDQQGSFFPEPCVLASGVGILPCRFPDQDCSQLCTAVVPRASATGLGGPQDWIVGVGVRSTWTYTTQGGQTVARNVADPTATQLIILRISWDGARWHVTPIFGHTAALPATDDAACDSALTLLDGTTWGFVVNDPPPGVFLTVGSDMSPVDGCVAVVANYGTAAPTFLARFGVLLTVNATAVNPQDGLPMANPSEQRLARQLMSPLSR